VLWTNGKLPVVTVSVSNFIRQWTGFVYFEVPIYYLNVCICERLFKYWISQENSVLFNLGTICLFALWGISLLWATGVIEGKLSVILKTVEWWILLNQKIRRWCSSWHVILFVRNDIVSNNFDVWTSRTIHIGRCVWQLSPCHYYSRNKTFRP
jgi:hypothetical protein